MRRLRYSVAMSLDGYIADVDGGYDWIVMDPGIDFAAYMAKIDTLIMGRRSFEISKKDAGGPGLFGSMKIYVVSTSLDPGAHPDVTVIQADVADRVRAIKEEDGKDIWLFGGGVLFRSLLEERLVDRVEVGVIPVLLGDGIPFLPGLRGRAKLSLHSCETYDSGVVLLKYDVG